MRLDIPEDAGIIINTLNSNGYEAYVVGGCVRDSLLGRTPQDWDITTSAKPEDVKRLFHRTIDTGIQHGTVTVRMHGRSYEVTTFRIDGEYEDNRHPSNVTYTSELKEDLMRRDFTINAMAYSPSEGLVDIYGGIRDINNRIIRCVGEPSERFDEDALRTLRAVRFAGQLDFGIEEKTYDAIRSHAANIANVSAERIRVELTKLIESDGADRIRLISETGIAEVIFPELNDMFLTPQNNPHHKYNVGEHSLRVVENIRRLYKEYYPEPDDRDYRILCWSALLHDIAKPKCRKTDEGGIDHFHGHPKIGAKMAEDILARLKFDNYTINTVSRLILHHDYRFEGDIRNTRRFISRVGAEIMPLLFILMEADIGAQSEYMADKKKDKLAQAERDYITIIKNRDALTVKELKINGGILMECGIPRGKIMGDILKELLEEVIEKPSLNESETLKSMALKIYEKNQRT